MAEGDRFKEIVGEVAAAYFSNSHVPQSEISNVIREIATSLGTLDGEALSSEATAEAPAWATPAQIRKSITPDALVSFEDGKPYKALKRHLAARGMTPEQYREKWGLPRDYPIVSPNYSAARSQMAKNLGLGQLDREAPSSEATAEAPARATPAQIRKSITPDALISFEDGKPYKALKRHLAARGMTPEQYREKWGLPRDYPIVSPNYSAARSQMAKNLGLGQLARQRRPAAPAPAPATKRGRRAKLAG